LAKYWHNDPLRTVEKALGFAAGMTCKGVHPVAKLVTKAYATGIKLSDKIRRHDEQALERAPELPKWPVTIDPGKARMVCALAKE
jgi:pyruvate/2-oxoglutarate/acetoin dehydrogenase E1 component